MLIALALAAFLLFAVFREYLINQIRCYSVNTLATVMLIVRHSLTKVQSGLLQQNLSPVTNPPQALYLFIP